MQLTSAFPHGGAGKAALNENCQSEKRERCCEQIPGRADDKELGSFRCSCRLVSAEYKLVNSLHRLLVYSQPFTGDKLASFPRDVWVWIVPPPRAGCLKDVGMWPLGMWFNGGLGSGWTL